MEHTPWDNETLVCEGCGWTCPWPVYKKTFKYRHPFAGGMRPFLEEFVREFSRARTHAARVILIDTLIHRYHWENFGKPSRPGACCLIEGKLKDIMPFLDGLTYGDAIPAEVRAMRTAWRETWRSSRWRSSP